MRPPISKDWNLFFPGYLILDGWGHIQVGQNLVLSGLDFSPMDPLEESNERRKSAVPRSFSYLVNAELVFRSREVCAIDFGIVAAAPSDCLPEEANAGDYLRGEITVGIERQVAGPDAFEAKIPRYKWRVVRITADITPHVPHPTISRMRIKDEPNLRYREVPTTAAVDAELHESGFILHCILEATFR